MPPGVTQPTVMQQSPIQPSEAPPRPTQVDELLRRLADGDRSASAPLFTALWPIVLRFCTRLLGSVQDAEDAAQQTLEKVFSRISQLDPTRPPLGWVLALATWECRTLRKRRLRSRETPSDDEHPVADAAPGPEAAALESNLSAALAAALGELPAADRDTLLAVLNEEVPEGVAGATFRKRRERALERLRGVWRALYGA